MSEKSAIACCLDKIRIKMYPKSILSREVQLTELYGFFLFECEVDI